MSTTDNAAATLSSPAGEMQMVQSQETHHSTENYYAAVQSQEEVYLHGGGEKFKRNHEDRGQKREI